MKKTDWIMAALLALALTAAGLGVAGCKSACCKMESKAGQSSDKEHSLQYYCPMHPEVTSNEPGKCPKCGMDLLEKP
jgi:hypothetical protein